MNEPTLFDIDWVDPNPYQTREREDPEHVRKIAESIVTQGLMQIPVGRLVPVLSLKESDLRVQLAFGHTRLAAFRLIAETGLDRLDLAERAEYRKLPVMIRELNDVQMFEAGVAENLARKDLTPIEEARAMKRYREEFKKTSAEIGMLFGLSESAVRNKIRLLDLPDAAQESLASGQITEGTARNLLTLQRVVKPDQMAATIKTVSEADPGQVQNAIEFRLKENAVKMYEHWRAEEPRGGAGLWLLDWLVDGDLPFPTWNQFQKAYSGPESFLWDEDETWSLKMVYEKARDRWGDDSMRRHMFVMEAGAVIDTLDSLVAPPACTNCPACIKQNGDIYCGLRVCWERKREAWAERELARISAESGIKIYDPDRDGKTILQTPTWYYDSREISDWFSQSYEKKSDELRLRIKPAANKHQLTKSNTIQVIAIGKKAQNQELIIAEQKAIGQSQADELRQRNIQINKQNELLNRYLIEIVIPEFMKVFLRGLSGGLLQDLVSRSVNSYLISQYPVPEDMKPVQRNAWILTCYLLVNLFDKEGFPRCIGLEKPAAFLSGLATSWGVRLPADWMGLARRFENGESVSTETPLEEPVYAPANA